ncbi:MAG: TatD family hydrolase [Eubacteriales bacterium]|nr:TatD family hydrolase [Eubacteriales bacterium]
MIFDTHAHYDDEAFDNDRDELLGSMRENNIRYIVNVGASMQGVEDTYKMMGQYDFVYGALGIHPDHAGDMDENAMEHLYQLLQHKKAVAVGEIGLDYYWDKASHEIQKKWFAEQMHLALEMEKPINVHSREAAQDTFDAIKREHAGKEGFAGGIIHCYSGSAQMAKEYVKLGYLIGVGGVVTFKNARVLKEVVTAVPLEKIVLETDCPYLAPAPFRGKRNSSLFLPYVIEEIARIKEITPQEVERVTFENACDVYNIQGDV